MARRRRSYIVSEMANQPWMPAAEKIMVLFVVICVVAILAVIGMHLGIVPGCTATRVC
jgi:hypothetical protein